MGKQIEKLNETGINRLSLLENESRGGDTGEQGFNYQAMIVLKYVPRWLRYEGFAAMVRESILDAEAKFYQPGRGNIKIGIEAKNHEVKGVEFWEEIDRFMRVEAGAKDEYIQFILACTGLAYNVRPIAGALRRVRDPRDFYEHSAILEVSFEEFAQRVAKEGKSREVAKFLYEKVTVDFNSGNEYGEFVTSFKESFLFSNDLRQSEIDSIYYRLKAFVQSRLNQTITRRELNSIISECLPADFPHINSVVRIHTAIAKEDANASHNELVFDWEKFFGQISPYPPASMWNQELLEDLHRTKQWILENRDVKRIHLSGNRRLSASLAIGSVFSAVSGFAVNMLNRNEEVWITDEHSTVDTPRYQLTKKERRFSHKSEKLIVTIGIMRDISQSVEQNLEQLNLTESPILHLFGTDAILSARQANLIVRQIKQIFDDALLRTDAKRIELFFAGPAALALFLGHRLNATSPIQCYEWITPSKYIPTCLLFERTS